MKQFVEICSNLKEAVYNLCGINVTKPVDMTVGAYLLNDTHNHTERLWDVLNVSVTGSFLAAISGGTIYTIAYSPVLLNDTIVRTIYDWGVGITTQNNQYNYINHVDGRYSIKVYAVMASGNVIRLGEALLNKSNGVLSVVNTFSNFNITYQRQTANCMFNQDYCWNTKVGVPYNNLNQSPQGILVECPPKLINELYNTDDSEKDWELVTGCEYTQVTLSLTSSFSVNTATKTITYTNPDLNTSLVPSIAGFINAVIIDWGDGIQEYIPSQDFGIVKDHVVIDLKSGRYEARIIIQTIDGEWHIYGQYVYDINDTTGTISTVSAPVTYSIPINRTVRDLIQHRLYDGQGLYFFNNLIYNLPATSLFALNCKKPFTSHQIISGIQMSNGIPDNTSTGTPLIPTTPVYNSNGFYLTPNTIPGINTQAVPPNTREIVIQNESNSDLIVTTSQGTQRVVARRNIAMANPNTLDVNHSIFTGNISISYLHNVGGNINGVQPRVIVNFKSY